MKKRILTVITAILMVLALCGQALAITTDSDDTQLIAGMSLDTAEPEMQEKILEARNEIIFSESWSADGVAIYIERQDGTTEKVPEFSELFSGWDMPSIENNFNVERNAAIICDEDSSEIMPLSAEALSFRVYLRNPSSTVNTSPFTHFTHNGLYVKTTVDTLYASEHCNIGFSNYSTGASLGYLAGIYPGESVTMDTYGWDSFECAVRASTSSTPGYSILTVSHDVPVSVSLGL